MPGFRLTAPEPIPRGPGLWTMEGVVVHPGATFPARMTVIQARAGADGDSGRREERPLLLVSAFPPEPGVLAQLGRLGRVAVVLAPNAMHCLWGGAMRDACPGAVLAGPPAAAQRFPAARWDAVVRAAADLEALLVQRGFAPDEVRVWPTAESE